MNAAPTMRTFGLMLAGLIAGASVVGCGGSSGGPDVRGFRGAGPITTPIDDTWVPHPDSDAIAAMLAEPEGNRIVNTVSFAVPVVEADPDRPLEPLAVTRSDVDIWGKSDLSLLPGLRVGADVQPAPGSDGKLVVIDREADHAIDMFQARRTGAGWEATWGGVYPLSGDGSSPLPVYEGHGPNGQVFPLPISRATGSGLSSLAGLLMVDEVAAGEVPHALVFATDRVCGPADFGPFFPPATTTDGWVTEGTCIEEGARIQLDPTIDLTALGLSPAELAIGQALQRYGAFCIDNGGSRIGFIAELASPGDATVYADNGLEGDYAMLAGLPWDRLRVLVPASPAGSDVDVDDSASNTSASAATLRWWS